MNLKSIGKKFQEKFQERKTPEEIVKEKVIEPTKNKNLTPEERAEKQAERIVEILKEYPEYKDAIVKKVVEDEQILQAAVDKSAMQAADSPEVSDSTAASLAKGASDEATLYVMENLELPENTAIGVAKTLKKEESKEEGTCKLLRNLYDSLENVEAQSIVLSKIQNSIVGSERTDDVNRELYKVIAKNFALTYYKCKGAISLYMENLIPLDEMMRVKMPQKIEDEYINLLADGEENRFNKKEVTNFFLERIAQKASEEAKEQGKSVDLFSPSNLGNLTDEEIEKYLDYLEKYTPSLTDLTRGNIKDRLKEQEQDVYTVDQFIATVRDLPDGERGRYLRILSNLSSREMDTVTQCIESGLIGNLSKKKVKDRRNYLQVINASIEKRDNKEKNRLEKTNTKYSVVSKEDTPKVKNAQWGDDPR